MANASVGPLAVFDLQIEAASDLEEIGFFSWDGTSSGLIISPRSADILGICGTSPPAISIRYLRHLPIIRGAAHLRAIRHALADGQDIVRLSFSVQHDDGDRRQIRCSIRVMRRGGAITALAGALVDHTDRRRSEAELRATMSTVPSAMIVIDERGLIRAFSAAAEAMFGRVASAMIGSPIETLMPEPYRSEHAGYLLRYLMTGEARIIGQSRTMTAIRADGTEFPIELWVGDASTDDERLFTGFIRDQSARFETEAKLQMLQNDLIHVARLSAIGELSMSLAHELNQPLGAIVNHLGTAEYLAQQAGADEDGHLMRAIRSASDQSMRAGDIVKRLRAFIEKGEADKRIEPVAAIISEATSLVSSAIRQKGIALAITIEDRRAVVLADRVQIQQVLFNLLRNAVEALEGSSGLKPALSVTVRSTADHIEISVEDNGPGVDAERAFNLFKPFSTGKPDGMGVGLSISRRIMEAHGGQLTYEPVATGGARFALRLPAAGNGEHGNG